MPKTKSRTASSMRNMAVSVSAQVVKLLLLFATRVVFLHTIGEAYLGVNGLYTNILTLLSLSELGFGVAIIYYMYKPVNDGDTEKIKSLLKLYTRLYLYIAAAILVIGCALIPFLNRITNMQEEDVAINLYVVYAMFLGNTVIGYLAAHKRAIIEANQDLYITNLIRSIFQSLMSGLQIVMIVVFRNYYLYLAIMIGATVVENITAALIANKQYPYIKEPAKPLDKEERNTILKSTSFIFVNKFSNAVLIGTDSIIISAFLSVNAVAYYENYSFVYTAVATFVGFLFTSISASVGNLIVNADKSVLYDRYKKITFIFNLLNGFTAVCLFVLLSPFVTVWAGEEYVLSVATVVVMVVSYYLNNSRNYIRVYKNASGLFKQGMFVYLLEAVLNIGISILLAYYLGLIGVIIGTVASYLLSCFIMEPIVVFKKVFEVNPVKYYLNFVICAVFVAALSAALYFLILLIPGAGIGWFILKAGACALVAAAVCLAVAFIGPHRQFVIGCFGSVKRMITRKRG